MVGIRTRFVRAALLGGVLVILFAMVGVGSSAMAQEAEESTGTAAQRQQQEFEAKQAPYTEAVTVTGTLIPRPTLDALSPVSVMGVEDITYSGVTRIEDLMASLPQAFAGQNSTWANGATGTATVDLRQLGTNRTLVLINGRRMAPGDASGVYAPDLNVIPAALVERVDVLTGGASAVYGSDAVTGVVNFILDTQFEGFRGDVQYSFYQHDNNNTFAQQINEDAGFNAPSGSTTDGEGWNLNVAWGGKFGDGKGHASAYIGYREMEAVTKSQRDYLNCSVWATDDGPICGGSSTSAQGRFIISGDDYIVQGDQFVPRQGEVFNYGPFNHIQRPDERWTAGAFLNYKFNDKIEGFAEIMLMNNFTNAQIAPSGNFNVATRINCDNPMLSDQQRQILCTDRGLGPDDYTESATSILRRNVEGGARNEDIQHTNFRLITGIRGDINDAWSYELYGLEARTNSNFSYDNDLDIGRMANALDVDGDPNDEDTWVCNSGDAGCYPWNIFETGAVDQRALDYMETVAVMYGITETQMVNLSFTGDLEEYGVRIPSATEGIQVALGADYRSEYLRTRPDYVYGNGLAAGFGGGQPAVEGDFSVTELFAEALVPLVQDVAGAQNLSLELGYRYSDYTTFGAANTYKVMGQWAPMELLKFRGGYNRAVRSANAFELFEPVNFGLGGSQDICSGAAPTTSEAACANTGVLPGQYGNILENPAGQYNTLGGGNDELDPEIADTVTFGIVLTPPSIPGFSLSFDYFNIEIDEAIGTLGADDIVQTCANTGDPELCGLINRDPDGSLWLTQAGYTETNNQNIGLLTSVGVDMNFSYTFPVGKGGFMTTDLMGTYLMETLFENPLVSYDCAGYYGFQCGQPNSEWRHRARITWNSNFDLALNLTWRYVGAAEIDDASPDSDIGDPGAMPFNELNGIASTDAWNYLDLSANWTVMKGIQWSVGVNNVLDDEPPLWPDLADDGNLNTYATYDPLGRYIYTAFRFDF
jgi:iron complex outermembrane receptor protein